MTWFDYVNYGALMLFSLSVLYPVLYLFFLSLSTRQGLVQSDAMLLLWPQGFTLKAYIFFLQETYIYSGYLYTVGRTVVGTAVGVMLMCLAAYALSRNIPLRKSITFYFVFTIFFTGGLIPTYLLVKDLGLLNNPLVYVLGPPFLFNTFYMLILRNFFMTIPESLVESAKMDGASDWRVFFNIMLPLSVPAIVTVCLWVAVAHWNSWFDSLIYIQDPEKQVIQIHVRKLIIEQDASLTNGTEFGKETMPADESMRAAAILIAMIPILCVYPFIQRYFVKGIVLGAVKG